MKDTLVHLSYEIELVPGEKLTLPQALVESVGPGRWLISVRPANALDARLPVRDHSAFLRGYTPEDEGLYDDYPSG